MAKITIPNLPQDVGNPEQLKAFLSAFQKIIVDKQADDDKLSEKVDKQINDIGDGITASGGTDGSRYIKFRNGIMICWCADSVSHTTINNVNNGTYGWSFYSGSTVITLPASFVATSAYQVAGVSVTWGAIPTIQKGDGNTITMYLYAPNSGASNVNIIAIGRWK